MQRYKEALQEKFKEKYGGEVAFPDDKYKNSGTNKLSAPITLPDGREVFLAVVHGKDAKKAMRRINGLKEYADFNGGYQAPSGERPDLFTDSPDYEAIIKAVASPSPVNGVMDRMGNPVNANIYQILDSGTVTIGSVETAFYIAENIVGQFTKLDGYGKYPPDKALVGGRNFSAIHVTAERLEAEKGIDLFDEKYLGKEDPYDPKLQVKKLQAILDDQEKLKKVGIGVYKRDDVKAYSLEEDLNIGKQTIERMLKVAEELQQAYSEIGDKLKKGLVHGDPWFDNVMEEIKKGWDGSDPKDFHYDIGKLKTIDLDDAGLGYVLMDVAMAINARNGIDEKGQLNETGKMFIKGWDEVSPLDKNAEEFMNLLVAVGGSYINVMRVEKFAAGAPKRDFEPELKRAERHNTLYKEKADIGIDRSGLIPNSDIEQQTKLLMKGKPEISK